MKKVTIYTDGAARGNPNGPGGYGAVLEYVDANGNLHTKEISAGYQKTTNNRMELMGLIRALECLKVPVKSICIPIPSTLWTRLTRDGWRAG